MIRINLLPHREMRRERRKKEFVVQAVVAGALGLGIVGGVGYLNASEINAQNQRNKFIADRNKNLDAQIQEIANLQTEIESLRARQTSVEQLQANRTIPVHMLDELVQAVPEGVYLKKLRQQNRSVLLVGQAQTNERIADLLRNLVSYPTFEKPQLGEIKAITQAVGDPRNPEKIRRLYEFTLNVLIKGPTDDAETVAAGGRAGAQRVARR